MTTPIIDMHSHWGTPRGYPFQTPEELAQQERVFKSTPRYVSETEMAEHFRKSGVRVMLDLGVRMSQTIDEASAARLRLRHAARAPGRHSRPLAAHRTSCTAGRRATSRRTSSSRSADGCRIG